MPEINPEGKIVEGQVREFEEGSADRGSHGKQGRSECVPVGTSMSVSSGWTAGHLGS